MEYRPITEGYAVSGQITPEDIADSQGRRLQEHHLQPARRRAAGPADGRRVNAVAAEAAELIFRHIPVISGQMTDENVDDQAEALDEIRRAGLRLLPLRRALAPILCADPGRQA